MDQGQWLSVTMLDQMRDHKSLRAWQEAHVVVLGVLELSRLFWKPYARALFAQLQRSSLSVQLNIAEGYTYGDSRSFTRFLSIAYGSAVETRELLELAAEAAVVPTDSASSLLERVQTSQFLLFGLLRRRRRFDA